MWPVKPTKRTLPCCLASGERFEHAVRLVGKFGIVVVDDIVYLPNVEVIGLQAGERVLEHAHGNVFFAAVGADAGHQEWPGRACP